ncbi:MAG: glycosyltransferase family 4 protein [Actinomycetes bacterium]
MRVLYLIDGLAGGGAETSLAEVAPQLTAVGVELHVGFYVDRRDVAERLRDAGAHLGPMFDAGGRRQRVAATRRLIRELRPQMVHTTLYEADIAGRTAAALCRTPVISSLVNEMYGPRQIAAGVPVAKLRAAQAVDIATARFVDRFHAISQTVGSVMASRLHISPSKIEVIHRARDARLLGEHSAERRARVRRSLGIDDETRLILGVGRVEPQKGFSHLVEAAAELKQRGVPIRVLIAGREGNDSDGVSQAIEHHRLGDVVTLLGRWDDVADLMVAADVLAFTSLWEGFGGTVIEALAVECPVVCFDLPVLREVLGEHAEFVPLGNSQALAATLETTLRRKRDPQSLERGRRLFLERYTIEVCAERTVEMYRRVIAGH